MKPKLIDEAILFPTTVKQPPTILEDGTEVWYINIGNFNTHFDPSGAYTYKKSK